MGTANPGDASTIKQMMDRLIASFVMGIEGVAEDVDADD